jgi:hypothetical protein
MTSLMGLSKGIASVTGASLRERLFNFALAIGNGGTFGVFRLTHPVRPSFSNALGCHFSLR